MAEPTSREKTFVLWTGLGVAFGASFGAVFQHIVIGVAAGTIIGAVIGIVLSSRATPDAGSGEGPTP